MHPAIEHSVIERFKSSPNPCILVGAGISYKHPTNIPLFAGLRDAYLDAIDPDRYILRRHAGNNIALVEASIRNLNLERFFSDLLATLGTVIFAPFDWMNQRPLNVNHYLLRSIVVSMGINTVLTTNFDTLLERSLPGFHSLSSMKSGFRGPLGLFMASGPYGQGIYPITRPAIIYLHGQAGTGEVDITTTSTALPFDRFDYANLAGRLRGATLLVIGYGGGDIIDIVPLLTTFNIKELIWVHHTNSEQIQKEEVPGRWLERVTPNGVGIKCKTDKLLSMLAGGPVLHEDPQVPGSFTEAVSTCLEEKLTIPTRHYLLSCFVNAAGYGDIALSILDACPEFSVNRPGVRGLTARRARAISLSRSSDAKRRALAKLYLKEAINLIPSLLPNYFQPDEIKGGLRDVARECGLAYESLGILYYEAGEIEESIRCCELARQYFYDKEDIFRLDLHQTVFHQERSLHDIVGEQNAQRIREYEDAAADVPLRARAEIARYLSEMGEVIYENGKNLRLAIGVFELALKYDPLSIKTYVDISSLRLAMDDIKGAMLAIEKGLGVNDSHYQLLCNKGVLLNAMGRQRDAKAVLKQVIEINEEDPLTWNNLGKSHHELGELEEAKNAYIQAVILDPSLTEARYNLEQVQLLLNEGSIKGV